MAESEPERRQGRVKWFNSAKGFGFINLEDTEEEVFVHQSNIDSSGFRSLREGEEVEFDLIVGDDGKKKAFNVTGPDGVPPEGTGTLAGFSGRAGMPPYPHPSYAYGGYPAGGGRGRGFYPVPVPGMPGGPPDAYMSGYYMPGPNPGGYFSPPGSFSGRGRAQFFPGGRNWAGARPPPPGQPGFSSGLQVVVHNLPWDCTWQQLKDSFSSCGEIERADVVFDSRGRSRGFGIVRFTTPDQAEQAVEKMNNSTIGGRIVSVRIDRFA